MKYIRKYIELCRRDKMRLVCSVITALTIMCTPLFVNAFPRLLEALRDMVTSLLFYIIDIAGFRINPIYPTVIDKQKWLLLPEMWKPISILPHSWSDFLAAWGKYFGALFDADNFAAYFKTIGDLIYYSTELVNLLIFFIPFVPLFISGYKKKRCTDRNKKSPQLIKFEKFLFGKIYPAVTWCKGFIEYCVYNDYFKIWALIWCLYFNIYSIVISFLAYYLYLIGSWDFLSLYTQLLKLQTDLTPVIRFIPGIVWLCIGAVIYDRVCRSMAFNRLYYAESANAAFLRTRGNITSVYGEPGLGKTQLITSMALTGEIKQFDDAFRIMLDRAAQFPNFPWQKFRDAVKKQIEARKIVDVYSCRHWVRSEGVKFNKVVSLYSPAEWKQVRKRYKGHYDHTFGYDYEHYSLTYNNELEIIDLFDALESYACAYLMFTVKTTLIFANYSIRVDSMLADLGNMPYRDNDFFHRAPEFQDAYSQHSHIIDFDMIRLGKQMIEDNPKGRMAPCGVFVISEIDKEFKNSLQLKETKANDEQCNQKNDLHDAALMMIRHAVVIDHVSFVMLLADLQRPEAWGANGRELGDTITITDKDELAPALPFFSPYWILEGAYSWLKGKFESFKVAYDENRSDGTLFVYLVSNLMSALGNYFDRINGLFGMQTLTLEIQSGKLDGTVKKDRWRVLTKKDRSKRYRTDCLASIFESYEPNTMYIDDFKQYAGALGTQEENALQNSFFQNDVIKMKGIKKNEKKKL